MLLALHRWTPPTLNPRSIFHALGFGCVLTLCLMIALARPLQDNFGDITADYYVWWWVVSAAFLGATEWWLSKVLSK